jgi:multiple sugar transport system ATP-binding protein
MSVPAGDTPQTLYWSPVNLFVAAFIGSPSMNLVEAVVEDGALRFGGFSFPLAALGDDVRKLPKRVTVGFRPEHLTELHGDRAASWWIEAEVSVVENLGAETLVFFPLDVQAVEAEELVAVRSGRTGRAHGANGDAVLAARLGSTARE